RTAQHPRRSRQTRSERIWSGPVRSAEWHDRPWFGNVRSGRGEAADSVRDLALCLSIGLRPTCSGTNRSGKVEKNDRSLVTVRATGPDFRPSSFGVCRPGSPRSTELPKHLFGHFTRVEDGGMAAEPVASILAVDHGGRQLCNLLTGLPIGDGGM